MDVPRISRIAGDQDGLITRAQASAAGATPSMLRHALRPGGEWQRVVPGIYATFTGPLGVVHRLRAAVLHGGSGSLISGHVACRGAGLHYGPDLDRFVDVLVRMDRRPRGVGFIRVHRTVRLPPHRYWWAADTDTSRRPDVVPGDEPAPDAVSGRLPIVPPARAVVDTVRLADGRYRPWGGLRDVRALVGEAVQRRACSVEELETELGAAARGGTRLARRALVDIVAGCRSAPECELRDLVAASALLPEARWNEPLPGQQRIRPDACWPEARLVVEVDSRAWHGFGDAPELTERRRARYAECGWTVVPVSPRRIRQQPRAVRTQIEAAYRAGSANRAMP